MVSHRPCLPNSKKHVSIVGRVFMNGEWQDGMLAINGSRLLRIIAPDRIKHQPFPLVVGMCCIDFCF